MKKYLSYVMISLFFISSLGVLISPAQDVESIEDIDPMVDLTVTLTIDSIRYLEATEEPPYPNLYVETQIDGTTTTGPLWEDTPYLYDLLYSVTIDVSDTVEEIPITIKLFEKTDEGDILCDLGNESQDIQLMYNMKTGHWTGDDYLKDPSGYGRCCGCDDGSRYRDERDCELWLTITQNDYDNDTLPYWTEVEVYQTNPLLNDLGSDEDGDGVPIEWEHHWGYDPFILDDHAVLDDDIDSITNIEEYLTWSYQSDPFRQDIFLEVDWMEESPTGHRSMLPELSKDLVKNPFHRRNILFHFDTTDHGGELIPYANKTEQPQVLEIYNEFFLHQNTSSWRRSVFHYAIIVNRCNMKGFAFSGDTDPFWGYIPGTNGFVFSSSVMEEYADMNVLVGKSLPYVYGSVVMHEMGHNFGIRFGEPWGCDNWFAKYPWQPLYWTIRNYVSIMNYQYTYKYFDYSDGENGWNDFDDWGNIDLTYFEKPY